MLNVLIRTIICLPLVGADDLPKSHEEVVWLRNSLYILNHRCKDMSFPAKVHFLSESANK